MCVNACKPPFGWTGKPCEECAAEYAEWLDFLPGWLRELKQCRRINAAVPATDQERRAWLDQVAPVVNTNYQQYHRNMQRTEI